MAGYKETKLDQKLYRGPVDGVCGNPRDRMGDDVTHGGEDMPGGHKESPGVIETVTYDDTERGTR